MPRDLYNDICALYDIDIICTMNILIVISNEIDSQIIGFCLYFDRI